MSKIIKNNKNKPWYGRLGFERDPFFMTPITEQEEDQKGFVNREREKEHIEKFIDLDFHSK